MIFPFSFVVADFNSKSPMDNTPVHIINVDIQDNQEEATIGAFFIWELVQLVGIQQDLCNLQTLFSLPRVKTEEMSVGVGLNQLEESH